MVGLIVLVVFILYIGITLFCIKKVKGRKQKILVSLIFILIPTADGMVGRVYFSYLCDTQSGQFIYKTVEVDDEYLYKPGEMMKHKLDETGEKLAIAKGGEINREKLRERYDFRFSKKTTYSSIFHISKRKRTIKDITSGEILGESISFLYHGGWVINIYPYGVPRYCEGNQKPGGDYIHSNLFDKTFIAETQ